MLVTDALNPLARDVAEALFKTRPEWRQHARALARDSVPRDPDNDVFPDDGGDFLLVEVPAPSGNAEALRIETGTQEVTVSNHFHTHLVWPDDAPNDVMTLIDEILTETIAVISHADGDGPYRSSTPIPRDVVPPRRERWPETPYRVRIRSWHGTLDRDF